MKTKFSVQEVLSNFPKSLFTYKESIEFIQVNKLWKGMDQYGWLSKALAGVVLILGMYAYSNVETLDTNNLSAAFQSISHSVSNLSNAGANFVNSSYFKYLVFILMEVVIFHFARRTLEIKTGKDFDTTFKAFWNAERRMIKVAIHCAVTEGILTILLKIVIGIFGFKFLFAPAVILMQCYFLGFMMLDNFNEIFHLTIKESLNMTRSFAGVALGIGFVSYVLMMIPLVGAFLAPLLGAVTAALVMHSLLPDGPVSESHVPVMVSS